MIINTRNENSLIEYLLNYAFNHDISYRLIKVDPHIPSLSFKKHQEMFINMNWYKTEEIPFILAHEIGHLLIEDLGIIYFHLR